jgi:Smg protein
MRQGRRRAASPSTFTEASPLFDILVYLFESYVHADACPESEQLARKLAAAGFEDEEISEALEWLAGLRRVADEIQPAIAPAADSVRIYAESECAQLSPACRGFIAFLENSGVLDGADRELIIERAMALDGFTITLDRLKVIVLMVLWQREQPMDTLVVDELLTEDDEDFRPVLH